MDSWSSQSCCGTAQSVCVCSWAWVGLWQSEESPCGKQGAPVPQKYSLKPGEMWIHVGCSVSAGKHMLGSVKQLAFETCSGLEVGKALCVCV